MAKQTLIGNWSLLNSKGMLAPEGIKGIRGRKTSDSLQLPVAIVTSMQLRISRTRQHRPPLRHCRRCRANRARRCCVVRYCWKRKSVYFLRKTKMADGRFLVFCRALLGWSVFAHVAPSRTLYGRGFKALWRFRGHLVARTRGYRGQPFSTPLY